MQQMKLPKMKPVGFYTEMCTQSGFPYFCSNLVKLDELDKLGKIYSDSVETLYG